MPMTRTRGSRSQDGQVLVLFALFLVVLLGATAVAIDYGSWLKVRRDYQNYADAAAIAGSAFLTRPIDTTKREHAREAAWQSLKDQLGLSIDPDALKNADTLFGTPVFDNGYRMWVSTPPIGLNEVTAAKYPGARRAPGDRTVFVWVERDNPSYFARIMGIGDANISAWATAGLFPNRWAVITLRQTGQDGPASAQDILIAGNNSGLEVVGGDVGGNWGMKLNADSHLWLRDTPSNDADVYLIDYISCGSSCWNDGQISSGDNGIPPNVTKDAQPLPGPIDDPNYPLPPAIATAPASAVSPQVPEGDANEPGDPAGNIDVRSGGPDAAPGGTFRDGNGVLHCLPDSPKIGPGYYTSIQVRGGACLILDPTMRHSSVVAAVPDVPSTLPSGQMPGIFYINGPIDVDGDAMIVGDGVSVFIRPHPSNPNQNRMTVQAGGSVDLNTGLVTPDRQRGAWTVKGLSTYSCDAAMTCTYNTALNSQADQVGVALYVIKRSQFMSVTADNNSDIVKINANASLTWKGVTYAPHDNVELSGQPGHDGIGQLVSWTFKFAGGTNVIQIYDGLDASTPRLLEPTLGQ